MKPLGTDEIKKILPHREPMLLIDKVIELEPGKRVVAIKDVTHEEEFLKGHFPNEPIMPGTMIVEAMAQASIMLYHSAYESTIKKTPKYYLGSIKAHFTNPVFPGDELRLTAETVRMLSTGAFVLAKAYVGEKQVAEADLVFAVKNE